MKNFDNANASNVYFHNQFKSAHLDKRELREQRIAQLQAFTALLAQNPSLKDRFERVSAFSKQVRVSEYHLTNACNIRCQGCWFFEFEHDRETREVKDLDVLDRFLRSEQEERRINSALVGSGIVTERTRAEYGKWVDLETLGRDAFDAVEDAITADGLAFLKGINDLKKHRHKPDHFDRQGWLGVAHG